MQARGGSHLHLSPTCILLGLPPFIIALAATAAWSLDVVREEIPPCGPACVYTVLRLTGRDASVDSVRAVFHDVDPSLDWRTASLWHVREALSASGVACTVRKYAKRDVELLGAPAILYFEPGRWIHGQSRGVGHFVVLLRTDRTTATVADWNAETSQVVVELPRTELQAAWSGHAVVMLDTKSSWPASILPPALGAGIGMVLGAVGGLRSARRRKGGLCSVSGFMLATLLVSGCGGQSATSGEDEPPPLVFEEPSVDLGRRDRAESLTTRFKFKVGPENSVTIVAVETSCSCSTADNSVIRQTFAENSVGEISLVTRLQRGAGMQSVFATVLTDPESSTPLLLALHYRLGELPRPTASLLNVEGSHGAYAEAVVDFTHRRSAQAPPLAIIRAQCEATHFEITEIETTHGQSAADSMAAEAVVVDRFRFKLKTKEKCHYGGYHGILRVRWSEDEPSEIPTFLRADRPVEPALSHVFAGILVPGQEWAVSLPCRSTTSSATPLVKVETIGEGLHAQFSPDGETLQIRGTAPKSAGRFSGTVTLKYATPDIPELEIPVSGVVSDRINVPDRQ